MNISIIDIRAWMTVLQVLVFLGIVWWAFGGSRKKRFEQDAMLALDDDDLKGREQEHARHR